MLASAAAGGLLAACARPTARASETRLALAAMPAQALLRGPGQPPTAVWGYDGRIPGPTLRLRQGDRLRVDFENRLPVETTVNWHGIRLPNAMDGVPHLTQPPVPPGGRFTYVFDLPDAGTFWYHSHLGSAEQVERGLSGALVVEERAPPPVDRDLVWLLDDWRLDAGGAVRGDFGNRHDLSHAGRIGNLVTLNGELPRELAVRPGERLRLRIVNAANARIFGLQFDGQRPWLVARDGHPVPPQALEGARLVLGPGMRADLLLDVAGPAGTRQAVGDVFYPRAAYDLLQFVVAGDPVRTPDGAAPAALPPNPLAEPDLDAAVRHEVRFEGGMMGSLHTALLDGRPVDLRAMLGAGKAWSVNGVVSAGHAAPAGRGGHGGHGNHGHAEPMLTFARGQSCRLVFRNDTRWHHPIHLHGHAFRLIAQNRQPVPHRPWLDTVLLGPDGSAEVAFVADNPGDWMLHCHVLEHQEGGMMAVVRVR